MAGGCCTDGWGRVYPGWWVYQGGVYRCITQGCIARAQPMDIPGPDTPWGRSQYPLPQHCWVIPHWDLAAGPQIQCLRTADTVPQDLRYSETWSILSETWLNMVNSQ